MIAPKRQEQLRRRSFACMMKEVSFRRHELRLLPSLSRGAWVLFPWEGC